MRHVRISVRQTVVLVSTRVSRALIAYAPRVRWGRDQALGLWYVDALVSLRRVGVFSEFGHFFERRRQGFGIGLSKGLTGGC